MIKKIDMWFKRRYFEKVVYGTFNINWIVRLGIKWFKFRCWIAIKELHFQCWLWKIRGLKRCKIHGFHAQSWITGKCKECEE